MDAVTAICDENFISNTSEINVIADVITPFHILAVFSFFFISEMKKE